MSYSGHYQYIGRCHHHWQVDGNVLTYGTSKEMSKARHCPVCNQPGVWFASVNTTNGYGLQYGEDAVDAPIERTGFTDMWHYDHYGNRYATKHDTFKPVGPRWKRVTAK